MFAILSVLILTIIAANVETLAQQQGWDQFLADNWGGIVSTLNSVVNSSVFWNAFWLVSGLTIGTWGTYYIYFVKLPKIIAERPTAYSNTQNIGLGDSDTIHAAKWEPLLDAAFWAIYKSAWGKWQREEQFADSDEDYFLRTTMGMVAHLVTQAAIDNKLEIKGRPSDAIEFEPISPAMWQLVALTVRPDDAAIYKLEIIRRGVVTGEDPEKGLGKKRDIRTKNIRNTLRYDALLVNFEQFQSFFDQLGPKDGDGKT